MAVRDGSICKRGDCPSAREAADMRAEWEALNLEARPLEDADLDREAAPSFASDFPGGWL